MLKKIVIIGPESTGKSTLCRQLADAFGTLWVAEYARAYCENLDRPYIIDDLLKIAKGQIASENEALLVADRLLICDTDLYVLKVWSEHSFNYCPHKILAQIAQQYCDLYLLTGIDMPWQADPLREHGLPDERYYFYKQYEDALINSGTPWLTIDGNELQRLEKAKAAILDII